MGTGNATAALNFPLHLKIQRSKTSKFMSVKKATTFQRHGTILDNESSNEQDLYSAAAAATTSSSCDLII
jgi:hypothetical protein